MLRQKSIDCKLSSSLSNMQGDTHAGNDNGVLIVSAADTQQPLAAIHCTALDCGTMQVYGECNSVSL